MFILTKDPLEKINAKEKIASLKAGAVCLFDGRVRDHNDGKNVVGLEYEAAEGLCLKEGNKIITEAKEQFKVINAVCWHRTGKLKLGELAVLVGTSAAHRDDAFKACRYIIDQVKRRCAIWKKEIYEKEK